MEDLPFIVRLSVRLSSRRRLTTKSPPCEGGERGVVISSCIGISMLGLKGRQYIAGGKYTRSIFFVDSVSAAKSRRRPNLMLRNFKLVAADFSLRPVRCSMLSPPTVSTQAKSLRLPQCCCRRQPDLIF